MVSIRTEGILPLRSRETEFLGTFVVLFRFDLFAISFPTSAPARADEIEKKKEKDKPAATATAAIAAGSSSVPSMETRTMRSINF